MHPYGFGLPNRRLGRKDRDPVNTKDWNFDQLLINNPKYRLLSLPTETQNRKHLIEILDQGNLGSCVSNAGMGALRVRHSIQGIVNPDLGSRLWGYSLVRGYIGTNDEDSGGYCRDFFRGVTEYGFPKEKDYPYDISRFTEKPAPEELHDAVDQTDPVRYWSITQKGSARLDPIRQAIANGFPIQIGTLVDTKFLMHDTSAVLEKPTGSIEGGHSIFIVDYSQKGCLIVNSWSEDWGDAAGTPFHGGLAWMSWDYIFWNETSELWVVEHAPYFGEKEAA